METQRQCRKKTLPLKLAGSDAQKFFSYASVPTSDPHASIALDFRRQRAAMLPLPSVVDVEHQTG